MFPIRIMALILGVALALPCEAAQRRALLIGINDYRANDPGQPAAPAGNWVPEDLNGALNDVALMEQVLVTRFGFEPAEIQVLRNEQATRAGMLDALRSFVAQTGPDDIAYIHFSGHGSQVQDLDGDEPDGLDETLLPFDARTEGIADITDDELNRILAGLQTPNALVVFDSCHSGTATRGASQLRARSTPLDPRSDIYASAETPSAGEPRYVLMTGAADYQSALDGPIDEGRYYGLFTLSLGRSLGRLPEGSTVQDIHAETRREMRRIGAQFGLFAIPEAQLEGREQRVTGGILGEGAVALARRDATRLPWSAVTGGPGAGQVLLQDAAALSAVTGSVWAIYPPGDTAFAPGAEIATATVSRLDGRHAVATLNGSGVSLPPHARAVYQQPPADRQQVPVRLDQVDDERRRALTLQLVEAPGSAAIELVGDGEFARFVVDWKADFIEVYGAGGIQKVAEFPSANLGSAAAGISRLVQRSKHVFELQSLDNPSSEIVLDVTVNPRSASGAVRGIKVTGAADTSAYRVRKPGDVRDSANSLLLEVRSSHPAYLTIVDVDPDGNVSVLFPNAISQRNGFYTDGLIPGGSAVRIPDRLGDNAAGFNWDLVPPTGVDTIRVFAAADLDTAETLRAYVNQLAVQVNTRGATGGQVSRGELWRGRSSASMSTRGVATVASGAEQTGRAGDWAAASVTIVIER